MKLFLAGSEVYIGDSIRLDPDDPIDCLTRFLNGHRRMLFSYLYLRTNKAKAKEIVEVARRAAEPDDLIMDSGAFSFMFGAHAGQLPPELPAYDAFVEEYIDDMKSWGWPGIVVEMDVDRLLGVDALERLRERFAPLGDRVMYAWHKPQGPEAMGTLARRFSHVSFSMIELSKIALHHNDEESMARDLLTRIELATPGAPPRVHLLGCNRMQLLTDRRVWSADATSVLSGVKFGSPMVFDVIGGKMRAIRRHSERWQAEEAKWGSEGLGRDYWKSVSTSAKQLVHMERHVNARVTTLPMRGATLPGGPYVAAR